MRIALLSLQEISKNYSVSEETGLGIIAAYLRKNNYEVMLDIIDLITLNIDNVIKFNPQIIGISGFMINYKETIMLCEKLKKINNNLIICVGGYLATFYPEELLNKCNDIDFVIRHEGEKSFLECINNIKNGLSYKNVKGVSYKENGKYFENEDMDKINLDLLPFQSRDIMKKYNVKTAYISSSRGCKRSCSFCLTQGMHCGFRCRDYNNLINEMEYIINNFKVNNFVIIDNSIEDGINNRLIDIAQEIIKRGINIDYSVSMRCESVIKLSNDEIEIIKKSGLYEMEIGVESGNTEDLKLYRKPTNIETNISAIKKCKNNGISISFGFINFNPYSDYNRLKNNIEFINNHLPNDSLLTLSSRLLISRGMPIYEQIKKDGLLLNDTLNPYNYRYVNKNIGNLSNFIYSFAREYKKNNPRSPIITRFYNRQVPNIIKRIKRCNISNHLNTQLDKYADINIKLLKYYSDKNYIWFNELLELSNNWDEHTATLITNKYFKKDAYEKNIEEELKDNYRKILKHVIENNICI